MGGNATAMMKDDTATHAEKTPAVKIDHYQVMARVHDFFKAFNEEFKKETGKVIWTNEADIMSGFALDGPDDFTIDQHACDLGITAPEELKEDIRHFLDKREGQEIIPGVRYLGLNKSTTQSAGEPIKAVFVCDFDGVRYNCLVTFEFLPYENNAPTEQAELSHSPSFEDAQQHIKDAHHKYLIRAMVGDASMRKDIVIAADTTVSDIFKVAFGGPDPSDINLFNSFVGVVALMKKYLSGKQIEQVVARYTDLLWPTNPRVQVLEAGNPQLDVEAKNLGYQYIIEQLGLNGTSDRMVEEYHGNHGHCKPRVAESFLEWLEREAPSLSRGEEL